MSDEPPPVLYLFLGDPLKGSFTDLLSSRRLKLSSIGNLNDPFDFIPVIEKMRPADIRAVIEARPDIAAEMGPLTPRGIAKIKAWTDQVADDPIKHWPMVAGTAKLLCMSARNDGVLLWAHYAARHRGFAVGFRTEELLRPPMNIAFAPVKYQTDRVPYSMLNLIGTTSDRLSRYYQLLTRKSPEWKYEEEWRAVVPTDDLPDPQFLSFPSSAVASIVLGSLIEKEAEDKIRAACEHGGLQGVEIERGELSRTHFKVLIRPSKWRV